MSAFRATSRSLHRHTIKFAEEIEFDVAPLRINVHRILGSLDRVGLIEVMHGGCHAAPFDAVVASSIKLD
jgi:hypothetical protein